MWSGPSEICTRVPIRCADHAMMTRPATMSVNWNQTEPRIVDHPLTPETFCKRNSTFDHLEMMSRSIRSSWESNSRSQPSQPLPAKRRLRITSPMIQREYGRVDGARSIARCLRDRWVAEWRSWQPRLAAEPVTLRLSSYVHRGRVGPGSRAAIAPGDRAGSATFLSVRTRVGCVDIKAAVPAACNSACERHLLSQRQR